MGNVICFVFVKGWGVWRHFPGMRALFLLPMLSLCVFGQGYVRPWVVAPPAKKAAGTLHSAMLDAPVPQTPPAAKRRVTLELPEARFPMPLILTPCTSFPGNPVFIIEGDKITMRTLDR